MGLIAWIRRQVEQGRQLDESLYAMAFEEMSAGNRRPGLWAKAFADADGDPARTEAAYLRLRVQSMKDELAAIDRAMDRAGVGPDDVADPTPPSTLDEPDSSPTNDVTAPTSDSSGRWWLLAILCILAVLAVVLSRTESHSPYQSSNDTGMESELSVPATPLAPPSADATVPADAEPRQDPYVPFATEDAHAIIPDGVNELETRGGPLQIRRGPDTHELWLNGRQIDLTPSYFKLLSLTRYPDQDIVLVAMHCGGSSCGYLDLAFIRIFSDRPPSVETSPEFIFPTDFVEDAKRSISTRDQTIDVALGIKDGAYWLASIGPRSALSFGAVSAPIQPLTPEDCKIAEDTLVECAGFSKPCTDAPYSEFPNNCPYADMVTHRSIGYLVHHTTGLNLPELAQACATASQLGVRPSSEFIRSRICSGADPAQWNSASPASAQSTPESESAAQAGVLESEQPAP